MNIRQRLARLEQAQNDSDGCPQCGAAPGAPVAFELNTEPGAARAPDTHCPQCGRVLSFTIRLGDEV